MVKHMIIEFFIMKTSGEGESERVKYTVSDAVRRGWIKSYSDEGMENNYKP